MSPSAKFKLPIVCSWAIIALSSLSLAFGPLSVERAQNIPIAFWVLSLSTAIWSTASLIARRCRHAAWTRRLYRMQEALLALSLFFFLFTYIYARNANFDYFQRFLATDGDVRQAIDTTGERLRAWVRLFPYVALHAAIYLLGRRKNIASWSLALVGASAFSHALSIPSFANLEGIGPLGFIALVPLLLVLRRSSYSYGIFCGVVYTLFFNLAAFYWLATFSLISLHFVSIVNTLIGAIFFAIFQPLYTTVCQRTAASPAISYKSPARVAGHRTVRKQIAARLLSIACATSCWTLYEYSRSVGFLAFPWGLLGHSQYANTPFIQLAALGGVWLVGAVVIAINAAIAETLEASIASPRSRPIIVAIGALAIATPILASAAGAIVLAAGKSAAGRPQTSSRIAAIQQNSDPRRHNYAKTFETLTRLTEEALNEARGDPVDLVVWPETAFIPNIRRWSAVDPASGSNARLTARLLEWLPTIETPLITGNDDYFINTDPKSGETIRSDYNAAILFSDSGERQATYHKQKLVPFTEYFPYKRLAPWIYGILERYGVHFWEPGDEATIFRHPKFSFATPICFEDTFPSISRRFILNGADLIVNLSNDYWSLTAVEARQHMVAALFRSVENRRPMVRATTSGHTVSIDAYGRLREQLPHYREGYIIPIVDLSRSDETTLYTRFGDWIPALAAVAVAAFVVWSVAKSRRAKAA